MRIDGTLALYALVTLTCACAPTADNNQAFAEAPAPAPVSASAFSTAEPVALPAAAGITTNLADGDHARASSPGINSASRTVPKSRAVSNSAPFVGEARAAITVLGLLSPGRLEIVDGCLTVRVGGASSRATAIFPPGVKIERSGPTVTAVSFQSRRIPLNRDTAIPGGGAEVSANNLVKPVPARCPKEYFAIAG